MNYIIYNGKKSTEFGSLIINKLPAITRPNQRYEAIKIDGLDGYEYNELGYEDYSRDMEISIKNYTELDKILAWLCGTGEAVFSNEPDKLYRVRLHKAINMESLYRYGKATVRFTCAPYKYLYGEEYTTSYTIENKGTVSSKPYMKITGSGSTILHIDNKVVCTLNIDDGYLEIDSEKQECAKSGTFKNRNMIGNFPELDPGQHVISFQGGTITECMTLVRSRFV